MAGGGDATGICNEKGALRFLGKRQFEPLMKALDE